MNRRERLSRCFFYQEIDRPAVFSRPGFPKNDPTYDGLKAYLNEHAEQKGRWGGGQFVQGLDLNVTNEPHSEDFERRVEILQTPKGELRSTALVSLKGQPGLHETFFVNTAEDAEKYLSLPALFVPGAVDSFFEALKDVGDTGIVDVHLGKNPGGFVASLCGSMNFAMLSMTDREVLHRLCQQRLQLMLEIVKFLLKNGIGPFFSMAGEEYIVPPLHGPEDFYDFNVKYDKPIIDLIHEAGGRMHIHSHGSIDAVFQGFLDMGTDVLHPFEAPPQGDITACEAKNRARGRICLEGNIQIHEMYESGPEKVRALTEELIRDVFDDGSGLIVSPTASPYIRGQGDVCFPQYKAMIDTVLGL